MLQVIGRRASRTFRVLWLLEEIGVPYEHLPAAPHAPEVRALSPLGRIPLLVDGDAVISESMAILTYLADRHQALTFPAGSIDRARQDAVTHRILFDLEAPLWTAERHTFVLPEAQRIAAVADSLRAEFTENLRRFADQLGKGPFLMGGNLSIPDILAGNILGWASRAGYDLGQGDLRAYLGRLQDRPAHQRASGKE
ncbi:MAG: glutathione S-transferase [Rhodobacteraceae bacterium]|nr:glutathione S-transferase [Paracoccaceae bacterium]